MQVRVTLRKPGSKLEHLGLTAELIGDIGQSAQRPLGYSVELVCYSTRA